MTNILETLHEIILHYKHQSFVIHVHEEIRFCQRMD